MQVNDNTVQHSPCICSSVVPSKCLSHMQVNDNTVQHSPCICSSVVPSKFLSHMQVNNKTFQHYPCICSSVLPSKFLSHMQVNSNTFQHSPCICSSVVPSKFISHMQVNKNTLQHSPCICSSVVPSKFLSHMQVNNKTFQLSPCICSSVLPSKLRYRRLTITAYFFTNMIQLLHVLYLSCTFLSPQHYSQCLLYQYHLPPMRVFLQFLHVIIDCCNSQIVCVICSMRVVYILRTLLLICYNANHPRTRSFLRPMMTTISNCSDLPPSTRSYELSSIHTSMSNHMSLTILLAREQPTGRNISIIISNVNKSIKFT